jgi:hypothetical protein
MYGASKPRSVSALLHYYIESLGIEPRRNSSRLGSTDCVLASARGQGPDPQTAGDILGCCGLLLRPHAVLVNG